MKWTKEGHLVVDGDIIPASKVINVYAMSGYETYVQTAEPDGSSYVYEVPGASFGRLDKWWQDSKKGKTK